MGPKRGTLQKTDTHRGGVEEDVQGDPGTWENRKRQLSGMRTQVK